MVTFILVLFTLVSLLGGIGSVVLLARRTDFSAQFRQRIMITGIVLVFATGLFSMMLVHHRDQLTQTVTTTVTTTSKTATPDSSSSSDDSNITNSNDVQPNGNSSQPSASSSSWYPDTDIVNPQFELPPTKVGGI